MRNVTGVALIGAACVAVPSEAAVIQLVNANFETNVNLPDGGALGGHERAITGWTASAGSGSGVWNPAAPSFPDQARYGHVGFSLNRGALTRTRNPGMLAQDVTGEALRANTRYTLTVDVGRPTVTEAAWDYNIGLISQINTIEGFVLGQASGQAVAPGTFRTVTFVFETGSSGPGIGKAFAIGLTGAGGDGRTRVAFDNVRLEAGAIPEPATWAMMIAGFAGVGAAARRGRRPNPVLA